jgi:hypothetical protein
MKAMFIDSAEAAVLKNHGYLSGKKVIADGTGKTRHG